MHKSGGSLPPVITGIGNNSGLPPNIVDQLIQAERIPIENLNFKKEKVESRLKLVNDLTDKVRKITGTIGELANSKGFNDLKLISADERIVTGTVDPQAAVKGNWNVEVLQLARKAAALSNGFPDKNETEIGVGYFSFETPSGTKEVFIDGEDNTLETVANKINRSEIGLLATVINDKTDEDLPYRLMITGVGVGEENEVVYPTLYLLDGDQDMYFDKKLPAQNGKIKLDGFEIEVPDNTLPDLIPGVTLELKKAAPGEEINIRIKEDMEVVSGKVKDFVDAINDVLAFIQQQNQLTQNSDTSRTLGGDSLLRQIESRLRRLLQGQILGVGSISRLNQIGIEFNRNGTLDYKEDTFNTVLASDPNNVRRFLNGDGFTTGFVPQLRTIVRNFTDQAFGPLSNRKRSLENQIDRIDQRIDNIERRLVSKERSLRRRFGNLESTIGRLQSQSGILSSRLGAAPANLGV